MNTPVREGETIEGSRTMRNRPYPVLKCSSSSPSSSRLRYGSRNRVGEVPLLRIASHPKPSKTMVSLFSTSLAFTMHNHARLSSPASARAPVVSMNSLEYKFVYEQAGSNAKPAGYGKGDMKFDRQTPAPAYPKRSWASTLVYESAGANAKPLGA